VKEYMRIRFKFGIKHILYIALLTLALNVCLALNVVIPTALKSKISVNIVNSNNGKTVYSYQADTPRLIASNVKLFTALFGLESLKADFHWKTKLFYTGNIESGTLNGNIYLNGSGDPTLDDKALYNLFGQLKNLGIKKIEGNVVFDNSIFNTKPTYSMLEYTDYDVDTVVPNGVIINGNIVKFTLLTNNDQVRLKSNLYRYKINNHLTLDPDSDAACVEPTRNIELDLDDANKKITLSGQISSLCNNQTITYNLLSPFMYNKMVLNKIFNRRGITVNGSYLDETTPDGATLIGEQTSVSLEQALISMNNFSNNLIAETVLLSSAAYKTKNTDSYANSGKLFNNFLAKYQLTNPKFKLENGAGLSRHEYFTAKNVTHLLSVANKSALSKQFEATLPSPGRAGTLRQSFPKLRGKLYAKTGTLNDVSAYSGYLYAKDGKKYIIVLIANDVTPTQKTIFYKWANKLLSSM
jgi:serine-type D-Ala-D-Ala carboxypeptidase/endopeptidase (penicillin-binding protein 4)